MENPSSLRTIGPHPTAYVFTLIPHNLIFGKQWAYGTWPASWKDHHISFLEFFPIVLGLGLWCSQLKNKRVVFCSEGDGVPFSAM